VRARSSWQRHRRPTPSEDPGLEARELLAAYDPAVRELALAARRLVLELVPGLTEQVDLKSRLIAFSRGPRLADMVCVVMPLKAGVNLGIAGGATLPDPEGLMKGTGKRHRHVRLSRLSDLESPPLRELIRLAAGSEAG
jgi:hypothetical protein